MLVAVLSDIHANDVALRRCIEHAISRGAEAFCFLGDYVGDLAGVRETMKLLRGVMDAHPCVLLRGNKEDYWLAPEAERASWREGDSTTGTLRYTDRLLTAEDRALFASLPIARRVVFPGLPPLLLCHGSPDSNRGKLDVSDATRTLMERVDAPYILCGHTHKPFRMEHAGVTLMNPGAVGVALGEGGTTQYLLLHGERGKWHPEQVTLSYDVESAIDQLYVAGLHLLAPAWTRTTIQLLRHGAPPKLLSLRRAMELCRERTGRCVWPDIPEDCWEAALEEMNVEQLRTD